jgi:hypothetical protein
MRYVVLSILIIGYLYWSYWSIKELRRVKWKTGSYDWSDPCHAIAVMWFFIHIAMAIVTIGVLTAKYW